MPCVEQACVGEDSWGLSTPISVELAVIPEQCAECRGGRGDDAWCWSLSVIDVDSLVDVWDSPIPMSIVSAVSLESYPAERSEVRDHPSAVDMVYEELGSRNPRWD